MVLDLGDERTLDPLVAGAKAAWLARGLRNGLSVLPGFVVAASASRDHMRTGADALARRGSGGARLELGAHPLDPQLAQDVATTAERLSEPLVVRSSTILESAGEWSGAFTSYVGVGRGDLEVALKGCWASAFSVAAIRRLETAGIRPGSLTMAVLVQPAIEAESGGTARLEGDDIMVVAVAGSPAPLVQGWEPGVWSRVPPSGSPSGNGARALLGDALLRDVAATVRDAARRTGATTCEWAVVEGRVLLLQLGRPTAATTADPLSFEEPVTDEVIRLGRLVRRAPGPLGERLVLPWAIALRDDPQWFASPRAVAHATADDATQALEDAERLAAALTAEAWREPDGGARARAVLSLLRGGDVAAAIDELSGARRPDPAAAERLWSLVEQVRLAIADRRAAIDTEVAWHLDLEDARAVLADGEAARPRTRVGVDRWEPFVAQVVLASGRTSRGIPAAPGVGSGRLCAIRDPATARHFRPRDVIVATHPVPMLGALLWDAAAIVTAGGGPAAHLFESARAMGIPAVCGVDVDDVLGRSWLGATGEYVLAVDGGTGTVAAAPW